MLTDTSSSPHAHMTAVAAKSVSIRGNNPIAALYDRALQITIPSMGEIMFSSTVAHAYENFLVAGGTAVGHHDGAPFMDGDMFKWLEAATFASAITDDPDLLDDLHKAAVAISSSQRPDGYIHTKTTIAQDAGSDVEPFDERTNFETYNLGHLMTMACLHHRMTGEDDYLVLAIRAADFLVSVAKDHPEHLADCNICPSHYMGVIELYRTTGDSTYLDLSRTLLELHGGKGEEGSDDNQDVLAVRDQRKAVGHCVRANYLYAGMADYALESGDPEIIEALEHIWDDLVSTKLYVTGGCGALYDGASPDAGQNYWMVTRVHQSYGRPYQLPQTTAYNESCASIGLVLWAWRMLLLTGESRFADEIERVLYNALPAMVGLDGITYFYVNPLRQVRGLPYPLRRPGDPKDAAPPPSDHRSRQEYMKACFCCPPNIARMSAELPYYVYSSSPTDLWIHQYVPGEVATTMDGVPVSVVQETSYPSNGAVTVRVRAETPARGSLRLRVPGWSDGVQVTLNGAVVERVEKGYVVIDHTWDDDTVTLQVAIEPRLMVAHDFVEEAANQVCVMRGPVVYCLESADVPDGVTIDSIALRPSAGFVAEDGTDDFEGHVVLSTTAAQLPTPVASGQLYAPLDESAPTDVDVRLVPYGLWSNRGPGEMSVWLRLLR